MSKTSDSWASMSMSIDGEICEISSLQKDDKELERLNQFFENEEKKRHKRIGLNPKPQQQQPINVGDIFRATCSRDKNGDPYFTGPDENRRLHLRLFDPNNKLLNGKGGPIKYCTIRWNYIFDENGSFEVKVIKIITNNNGTINVECGYTENYPNLAKGCIDISDLRKGMIVNASVGKITPTHIFFNASNIWNPYSSSNFNVWKYKFHNLYPDLKVGDEFDNLIVTQDPVFDETKNRWIVPLQVLLDKPILLLDLNGLLCDRLYNPDGTSTTKMYENCYNFLDWCKKYFYVGFTTCGDVEDVPDDLIENSHLGVISGFKTDGLSRHVEGKPRFVKDDWTIRNHIGGIFFGPLRQDGRDIILESSTKVLVVDDKHGDEKIENLPEGCAIYLPGHDENSLKEGSPIYEILGKYIGSEDIQETTLKILEKEPSFNKFLPGNVLQNSQLVFPEIPFQKTCSAYLKPDVLKQMLENEINSGIQTYCVTEKSDGVRFFLVFFEGKLFLVDRTNTRYEVSIDSIPDVTDGTIFDGELVEQILEGKRQLSYLVFDVINLNTNDLMSSTSSTSSVSTDVSQLSLDKRLGLVRLYDGFNLQFVDKIPSFKEFVNFKLKVKDLYNLQNLKNLLNSITYQNDAYLYRDKEGTYTEVDGFIITNQHNSEIFKWKYPDKLTVDYRLTRENFLSSDTNKNLSLRGSDESFQYKLHPESDIHPEIDSYFRSHPDRDGVIVECDKSHILRVRYDKKNPNTIETAEEIQEVIDSDFSVKKLSTKPLSRNARPFIPNFPFKPNFPG